MKYFIPAILLFCIACQNTNTKGYTINGTISGKTPAKAFLQTYRDNKAQTIDSAEFINGEFSFYGSVNLPEMHYIKIGSQRPFPIFLENSNILILGNIDSLEHIKISGSKTQNQLELFNKLTKVYDYKMDSTYKLFKSVKDELLKSKIEKQLDSIYYTKIDFTKKYIKNNTNTLLSAYLTQKLLTYNLDLQELEAFTNLINPQFKESIYTKKLINRINTLRKLQPGIIAPEFSQLSPSGDTIHLSDFKGNYLLIDFWASWCGPCRRANPTIVKVYNKYNHKGLSILGVSMDKEKEAWLKAISNDNLSWQHVSTLNGWKNPVGKLYGVNSIPHTILIDKEGKIVKRGIHANELDKLLSALLNK